MWVDWVIALTIILGLILTIWAKVSHQTIVELMKDIKDMFSGATEESEVFTIYE